VAKDYRNRKYTIVPYDLSWPVRYEKISEVLQKIFGNNASEINHVGSTSIPGMAGKPTIDVAIFVREITIADSLKEQMSDVGYQSLGEYVKPGARLFAQDDEDGRVCNVHVFRQDDPKGKEMLTIRDYFRSHAGKVQEYSNLKLRLYAEYADDYGAYRKYKDAWLQALVDAELTSKNPGKGYLV
jgi:GrpB-like predicted nucleotidyltransferase (UPF0157 family)